MRRLSKNTGTIRHFLSVDLSPITSFSSSYLASKGTGKGYGGDSHDWTDHLVINRNCISVLHITLIFAVIVLLHQEVGSALFLPLMLNVLSVLILISPMTLLCNTGCVLQIVSFPMTVILLVWTVGL